MKALRSLAFVASASALLMASSAYASTNIDGVISPGEYKNAIVTNTPYAPGADTSLNTFGNGNENVAETTYLQNDPNGLGFDFAVQTDPAGLGKDNADASLGDQFTNVYFGNPTDGAEVVFELGNDRAYNVNTGQEADYLLADGIHYADTPGTTYANGGMGSVSEAYFSYAGYDTVLTELGITPVAPGGIVQVRDLQAFSYAGNNAGGARFGSINFPSVISAVPEPATWAMMLLGIGMMGMVLRKSRDNKLANATVA
jgi:hypothetical protein